MPEVILNHKGPIAVIPKQSLLAAEVNQLKQSLRRKRTGEAKKEAKYALEMKERELKAYLKKLGR